MRAQGYPSVNFLLGGLDAWMEEVPYPTEPVDPSPEAAREFARRSEVSRHFGARREPGRVNTENPAV